MSVFKCKMCGGNLEIAEGMTVGVCEYCGTKQTLPKLDSDKKAALYDRAGHFRRNNEFDKAAKIYEQILNEDGTDAEAYWSLVLCRYGIEYVEDTGARKRVPTVNRAQFTAVFDDENYKAAIRYADERRREIYEEEARAINEIQKGILAISQNESPFDVFICYKETDPDGRRTQDSVLAWDLYHQLTEEGYKVFFSRVTLEDKLGTAYEPYIFAALHSAKVMVVLGTKKEYFEAVWVKNEWSRFLALMKAGEKKMLIPAYRDMDPYDLPEEFSHLQAQNMAKLGFMQDLLRGIRKIIEYESPHGKEEHPEEKSHGANTQAFLKRAALFLADGNWKSADEYCEKVLDEEPECAQAYLYKLLAEMQVRREEELDRLRVPFLLNPNYQKIMLFGDEKMKARIQQAGQAVSFRQADALMNGGNYQAALTLLERLNGYADASARAAFCRRKVDEIREMYNQMCAARNAEVNRIQQTYERKSRKARGYAKAGKGFLIAGVCLFFGIILLAGIMNAASEGATLAIGLFTWMALIFMVILCPIFKHKGKKLARKSEAERDQAFAVMRSKYQATPLMVNNLPELYEKTGRETFM